MSFWHSRPNRARMPRRGLVVGASTAAVGALLVGGVTAGGATEQAASGPAKIGPSLLTSDATELTADDVTQVVPAAGGQLLGFAPPASRSAEKDDRAAQFRIAANLPAGPLGIPGIVLKAYKLAATRVAAETPDCKLPWYLLAGIGRIESGHAGNGNVNRYGDSLTTIRGPVLDGSLPGNEVIRDSDGGEFDGDAGHDRAMGPMQFIPSTWKTWGTDANGDGKADPDNIFDATLSAGRYLCAGVSNIMAEPTQVANVMRYNRSTAYAANVLGWAGAYAAGVMPTSPIPDMHTPPKDEKKDADRKAAEKAAREKADREKAVRDETADKPSTSARPSSPKSTTPSKPKQTQQCLGVICLPPAPAPKAQPKPSAKKPAPRSTAPNN